MNEAEFLLDCDSVSNLSSLSGCTLNGVRDGMEARMYDFLTVASDYTSLAELSNMSFEVEVVEELLASDDKNNAFLANLSGHGTLLSFSSESDENSFEAQSDTEFEVQSETEVEIQSDTEFEIESDDESEHDDIMCSNHTTSLDQKEKEIKLGAMGAKSESATSMATNLSGRSTRSGDSSIISVPETNHVFEANERLEQARRRRTEALLRYKNVISSARQAPVTSVTNAQQSLIHLVSAIEAMDGSAILASSTRGQTTARASAGSTRVRELRSRQQESLKTLVSTLETVHRDYKSPRNLYYKRPTHSNRAIFAAASASSKH